jgi:prepilin-type N-terminal cleavage/methylation domain-containing protein
MADAHGGDGMRGGRLSEIGWNGTTRRKADGFSLPELLAVLAMIAIAVAIGIPLVNEQVRIAEIRAAADDLALHLRAARMISVTKHKKIEFTINVDPTNTFEYEGMSGKKLVVMPTRVRIDPASDHLINFKGNGSIEVASTVILESTVSGARERWTATVNTVGLTTLSHARVN